MRAPHIDYTTGVSQQYQKLFEEMLERERRKNDGLNLSEAETNQTRGRIALLKELIALPNSHSRDAAQSGIEHPEYI